MDELFSTTMLNELEGAEEHPSVADQEANCENVVSEITDFLLKAKRFTPQPGSSIETVRPAKRKRDSPSTLQFVTGVFLRVFYPLNICFSKNITVGIFENLDYSVGIMMNHYGKTIIFTNEQWKFFFHGVAGMVIDRLNKTTKSKKTKIAIHGSDIEIDTMKIYGKEYVRMRDISKNDEKILFTTQEFSVLVELSPAVNRYVEQLVEKETFIREYIVDTSPDGTSQEMFSAVDGSILNRLPHEVYAYKMCGILEQVNLPKEKTEITCSENNESMYTENEIKNIVIENQEDDRIGVNEGE